MVAEEVFSKFENSTWGKKLAKRSLKATQTDFERCVLTMRSHTEVTFSELSKVKGMNHSAEEKHIAGKNK